MKSRLRMALMGGLTTGLTIFACVAVAEVILRAFPSLIGLEVLSKFEPTMRSAIASRLGLPTIDTMQQVKRGDGGPPLYLFSPNALAVIRANAEDLTHGAVTDMQMDHNGFCNVLGKTSADILIAGDSFTFCLSVTPDDTASQKLEKLSGLRTYNLGVRGVGPYEYLELLKQFAPRLHPKIAIMDIYEGNDLRDVYRFIENTGKPRKIKHESPAWSYAIQFVQASIKTGLYVWRHQSREGKNNFRYSASVGGEQIAMNVLNLSQDEAEYALKLTRGEISLDAFSTPLSQFAQWARANSITPVLTYFPSMHTAYNSTVRFEDQTIGQAVQTFSIAQRTKLAELAAKPEYSSST